MTVRMTERAAEEFKAVCASKSLPIETTRLRLDAERKDEQGKFVISLKLDDQGLSQDDVVEDTDGAQLVINRTLAEALGEARLDYNDAEAGFGLKRVQ